MSSVVAGDEHMAAPRHLGARHARRRFSSPVAVAALVTAAVPFAVHALAMLGGYFGQDDFIITYRAAHAAPYDLAFLFQDYNGHLQPGAFLLAWLVTAVAPLNHTVAVLPILAVHAVTLWLCWRVFVRLFGERWANLAPFAVFAASPVILFPTLWWAYAMQLFPLLLAMFAALHAHLRYLDEARPRHAVAAACWTLAGLAFYEKAALIPAVLVGVTVLLAPRDEVAPIMWALRRHRWVWLAQGALIAGFAVLYLSLTASQTSGDPVTSRTIVEFTGRSIVDTLLPGMFGGPFTASDSGAAWQTPPPVVRMVAMMAAVAVVVVSAVRSRRRALLPWLFLAAYLAVDLTLVATTRLGVVGPAVATDPRYLADVVPVAVLCAAFAFLPHDEPRRPEQPQTRLAVIAVTALLVAGSVVSFLRLAPALQFHQARDYVTTARVAIAERPGMVLFDGGVPGDIMIGWFLEDATTSRVVGLVPEQPRFDRPAEQIYRLDDTGNPQPIRELAATVSAVPGPVEKCGYLVEDGEVRIPLHRAVPGRQIVRIGYYTSDTGPGTVRVGERSYPVRFTEGLHVVNVVAQGPLTEVQVRRSIDIAPLCVTDVQVGVPPT
ncbi:ArnT family glycosyltransferase [Actinophytocola sp.]|uniref:ArnT family glycosyltransferase n=1 Tax=Actinophytocola sp. TaxID=1872138 RepID=UPI003D6BD065